MHRWTLAALLCVAPLLMADNCQPPEPRTVATFGDSLTTGAGAAPGYAEKLPANWTVADEAIAGQCGYGCPGFVPGSASDIEADLAALVADPGVEVVVAMWGTNDALHYGYFVGQPDGLDQWRQIVRDVYVSRLVASVNHALGLGVDVVVAFPPPVFVDGAPDGVISPRILEIRDTALAALAGSGVATVDLYDLLDERPDFFAGDGVHFTDAGAQVAADAIRLKIEQLP